MPRCDSETPIEQKIGDVGCKHRILRCLPYLPILGVVLLGFGYVYCFGIDQLYWDEWGTVPQLYERYANGSLTVADLWKQHNEHRIMFPRLATLALGVPARGNNLVMMYATECLLAIILLIFTAAFRERFGGGLALWWMAPVALLVFSFRQCENMLWGFQFSFVLVAAAATVAFWCLSRLGGNRFILMFIAGVLAATVSAFSSIQGLIAWPVGLGLILISEMPTRRRKIVTATLWALGGVLVWAAYFQDYVKPPYHPRLEFDWKYYFATLGGSLFNSFNLAFSAGLVFLAMSLLVFAVLLYERQLGRNAFWLAVMAMSFGVVLAITVGRSGFAGGTALASRYATFSIPFVASVYILLLPRIDEPFRRERKILACVLLAVMVFSLRYSVLEGYRTGRDFLALRLYGQAAICTLDVQPDAVLSKICNPSREVVEKDTATLERLKYSVFADPEIAASSRAAISPLPLRSESTRYAIDRYPFPGAAGFWVIRGWAVDWPAGASDGNRAGGVAIVVDGHAYPVRYGIESPGAVKSLGNERFRKTGFLGLIPAGKMRFGQHTISLRIATQTRDAVYETPKETFQYSF